MLDGEDLLEFRVRHNDRCLIWSIRNQCFKLDILDADSAIEFKEVSPSEPETWVEVL
jgi:hypothetical protein